MKNSFFLQNLHGSCHGYSWVLSSKMMLGLILFLSLLARYYFQSPCSKGVNIIVNATIETQYIVSNNWMTSSSQTVGKGTDFPSGNFFGTATQSELRSAEPEDCAYSVHAPEGYHVMVAILAVGLTQGRGGCRDFIELIGTRNGMNSDIGDGQYCSAAPHRPDLDSNIVLQYTAPTYLKMPNRSDLNAPYKAPVTCSENRNLTLNVLNDAATTDTTYIGFVVSFR